MIKLTREREIARYAWYIRTRMIGDRAGHDFNWQVLGVG
jgi:hypothetical protein